jgi:hypothetical protein
MVWHAIGILGAAGALLGAIVVMATRDFGFSVDPARLYASAYGDRDAPEVYLMRLAESHRRHRIANRDGVLALRRYLLIGLCGVTLEVPGSRRPSPYTEPVATPTDNTAKPATGATPQPAPQPPKIEPYPEIFIVEGRALGESGEVRSR